MSTVVAISRQFGSGGARVGRALAQRLGFRYADRQILADAARLLDIDAKDLEPLEERTAGFWGRVGSMFALGSPDTPFMPPALPAVTEADLFQAEQRIIREIAEHGDAVIVGRGAAHVLKPPTTVVRVFLHAPLASRLELAMAEYHLASRDDAATLVRESDRTRGQFVRRLTGQDWCDATLYDLSVNVGAVGIDRTVDMLVDLVQRRPAVPLITDSSSPAGGRAQ